MAGPVQSYLTTQTAAQAAFTVPFGLITFVNGKIAAATAAGEFNTTVDCSLFVTEDVSNLRIYLDSLGYQVEFAKDTNNKSLNIDWGKFLDDATDATIVYQGTDPWIVAGTVTANQGTPGATPWPVSISSFPGSLTVNQGTSPWIVSGSVTTSPDVNLHDGAGNAITSTGGALDVNITFPGSITVTQGTSPWVTSVSNFPAIQPVSQSGSWTTGRTWILSDSTDAVAAVQSGAWSVSVSNFPATQPVSGTVTALQGTSPWVVSGTVTANAGTGNFTVVQATGTNLHAVIDSGNIAASQSGAWTTGRTWTLSSGTDSVAVSGTVSATQGTSPWVVSGTVAATQSGAWTTGRTWALASGTDSVAAVQSGSWTVAGTGNFTVVQPTGTNLHTVLDSGTLTSITNALPAGTNVIGHVITDSGSTTVVTGNVTVVQPTGTNLHTVVDSGTVTANQGTANSLANRWPAIVTDGTNTMPTADVAARAQFNKITDGTDTLGINPDGSAVVQPILEYYVGQGQVFSLTGSFTAATGGADNPIFLIKNPNASGKTLRLRKLYVGCNVANVIVSFSIYYAPTITANGTAATPRNNLIGNGTASVTTSFSLPTLSSLGTLIFDSTVAQNGTAPEMNPAIDVPANQNIVIAANPASNNRAVQITAIWMEV